MHGLGEGKTFLNGQRDEAVGPTKTVVWYTNSFVRATCLLLMSLGRISLQGRTADENHAASL